MLFDLAKTNAYSPARVAKRRRRTAGRVRQRGYADAVVHADIAKANEANGAVALRVEVTEVPDGT